ncbi:MAG TPA: hypothetical protein VJB56_01850 [Candidatus Paceibacterota bacterium]|uniref:Uncharacterized protein n=1 Tax=Candidatus Giovannonibacteria bacterium RIFCSPLOWO2_01_FULL_46_32 TaxID=1798353 RepID=A0A1F5XFB7_9BACT|nr:MAG: hypothetical protein A3B19_01650 [Candidatus Giovannonibacteria bacterium RIFCSPLOWO2_01_FULL_46_32]
MENIKRDAYLFFSIVLGFLLSFLVHAVVEIWYIGRLVDNFEIYSFGLSWSAWFFVHDVASVILALLGVVGGYAVGKRWWQIVYVENRHWFYERK